MRGAVYLLPELIRYITNLANKMLSGKIRLTKLIFISRMPNAFKISHDLHTSHLPLCRFLQVENLNEQTERQ